MIKKKCDQNSSAIPAGQFHGRVTLVILLLLTATVLHGCITTAVIATIAVIAGDSGHTVTVEVENTPAEVYNAMLRVVDRTPNVKIDKRDDKKYLLEVSRGKNSAEANVKLHDDGRTLLTVTADAGEKGKEDEDLALEVVEKICDELGVKYRVVEK
jgi:hypothetical protein